jgi:co-chaperonin GroES (HSP10)
MRIRPLCGQILVELLPNDERSSGGIFIPSNAPDHERGEKSKPFRALVCEVGPWKKTRQGFALIPEIQVGQTVLATPYCGAKLSHSVSNRLLLIRQDDVLAVIENAAEV